MAGQRITFEDGTVCFVDYSDAEGSAIVNGRKWQWEFHKYCGPLWLKSDGEPRKCQCPTNPKVWDAFHRWVKRWEKKHSESKA